MNFPHEYYLLPTEERKKILDAEVKISDNIARVKISDNEAQIKISYNEVIKKQAELLMTYKRDSKMIQEFLTSTPLAPNSEKRPEHEPIDGRYSTFALAVHNIDSGIGVELTGNAVAVTTTRIVTAFHNIYDEIPSGSDMTESSEFLIKTMFSEESQCDVDIRIFNHAIITKVVFKQNKDDIEEMVSPILMKFVDGNYNEDWAVLEVVNGVTTYSGLNICSDLAPFQFLHICPVEDLPKPGMDYLKGYYFDLGLYKTSPDPEEALYCQKINHSQVITYKPRSCMYRMTGGLSRESSGCPYINSNGYLVAIHSASLDSSYSREPKTRFRMFTRSEKKRARLTTSNLKKFSGHSENHVDNIREEQERVYDDISSLGDSFTAFKEGFCLGKSTQFMSLLQNS